MLRYREAATKIHLLGNHPGYRVKIYGNCVHNQYAALSMRHIIDRTYIKFDPDFYRDNSLVVLKYLWRRTKAELKGYSLERLVSYYSGGKKQVYERAMNDLYEGGLKMSAHKIRMFVKPDKIPACEDKAPRAIQFRRPHFNLCLASYLKPLEKHLYKFEEKSCRVFAKGRNNQERAADILKCYNSIKDCVIIEADHSKFDSCVRVEHLKSCHSFYMKFFKSKFLYKLLKKQLFNKGITSSGLKYSVKGTRMSGDFDTGLGNSLINYIVLKSLIGTKGLVYLDGDDSLIFVPRGTELDFTIFEKMGFETKYAFREIDTFEFCQSKLIRADPPILARKPDRMLSHLNVCLKEYGASTYPELIQGKVVCEMYAYQGVPYVYDYLKKFRNISIMPLVPIEDRDRFDKVKSHKFGVVTEQAYKDFYNAFGIGEELRSLWNDTDGFVECVPSNPNRKKKTHVLSARSIQRIAAGYEQLGGATGICGRPGCSCVNSSGWSCSERLLRPKTTISKRKREASPSSTTETKATGARQRKRPRKRTHASGTQRS